MSETKPLLQPCPNCAALIDINDEEPFAQVHCPMCGTAMRVRTQFNNFKIEEILGAGGMGTVYRARDLNLERSVALKLLRSEYSQDQEYIEKFEREARITASINHPYVVKVFAFGLDHGLVYMAMELVDKGSLDDLIMLQTKVAESQVLEVGIQVAQGLQAAHRKDLIHRDVKPGNILFADAHTAKITDFGLALLMAHEAEARGEVWGTPYYVAPEKLNKDPEDFRSDIYSLGGTLFHAIAGRPPFEAETASLVALKHIKSRAVSLQAFAPNVSSETAYVVNRMLKQNPDERYQSYDDLIEHLNYALTKSREAGHSPKPRARVVLSSRKHERLVTWATIGILLALIVVGLAVFMKRGGISGVDRNAGRGSEAIRVETEEEMIERSRKLYEEARGKMVGGDYEAASKEFQEVTEIDGVPQPRENWALYHQGLSELFRGNEERSREIFAHLEKQGWFSDEPIDRPLGAFFVESASKLAGDMPIPESALDDLDLSRFGAIGALAYGLKNWALGEHESAAVFLEKFDNAKPSGPYAWIEAYRVIANAYLGDQKAYREAVDAADNAKTLSEKTDALEKVRSARRKVKTVASLQQKLETLETRLQEQVEQLGNREAADSIARAKAEMEAMEKLRPAFKKAITQYSFAAALKLAEDTEVESESMKEERDAMVRKARWLSEFKIWLQQKIPVVGYSGRFVKRNGGVVPGEVRTATSTEIGVVSPYGTNMVPWVDVSPQTVLAIAMNIINADPGSPDAAGRYWQAGVYAFAEGLPQYGKPLLIKAAESNSEFNDQLELFFESEDLQ